MLERERALHSKSRVSRRQSEVDTASQVEVSAPLRADRVGSVHDRGSQLERGRLSTVYIEQDDKGMDENS